MSKFNLIYESVMNEGGEAAGKLELVSTDVKTAREFGTKAFADEGKDINTEIPNFDKNYNTASILYWFRLKRLKRDLTPVIV